MGSTPVATAEPTERGATTDGGPGTEADGTTAGADLDLREANVVGVEVVRRDGALEFSVTPYNDDDGEAGYADWWQVETEDGDRLGRRELLHAHGTSPFTRSATVEVPGDVTCVVVRGHDRTHGYGGQAVLANVTTGATTAVRQGPEPQPFDGADCP